MLLRFLEHGLAEAFLLSFAAGRKSKNLNAIIKTMTMTNDELFDDLKQFINVKIDSVENRLEGKIDAMQEDIDAMQEDIDNIKTVQNEILNAVGQDIQEVKTVQQQHEVRLSKLETKTA